jgi:hypothetical protein
MKPEYWKMDEIHGPQTVAFLEAAAADRGALLDWMRGNRTQLLHVFGPETALKNVQAQAFKIGGTKAEPMQLEAEMLDYDLLEIRRVKHAK